jgi:hypothetical protein
MRARYIGSGWGAWKGLDVFPGAEMDVPEALRDMVARNPNFEIIEEKRGPGRPRKVTDDAA